MFFPYHPSSFYFPLSDDKLKSTSFRTFRQSAMILWIKKTQDPFGLKAKWVLVVFERLLNW